MTINRRAAIAAALCLAAILPPPPAAAREPGAITGTWELVSLYDEEASGEEIGVFGPSPKGRLTLDKAGFFSFVILTSTPLMSPRASRSTAPMTAEMVGPGTLAYYGTYTVDETQMIRFHIRNGLTQGWMNADREASFELSDDRMSLVSSFGSLTGSDYSHLTWKRLCD
jgi:hypothetical protein